MEFLKAFSDYTDRLYNAPNALARDEVEKAEYPKLCAKIRTYRVFNRWTALVVSVDQSERDASMVDIFLSVNGTAGVPLSYGAIGHVSKKSPLYSKIAALGEDSEVTISGQVAPTPDNPSGSFECDGDSQYGQVSQILPADLKLTDIDAL